MEVESKWPAEEGAQAGWRPLDDDAAQGAANAGQLVVVAYLINCRRAKIRSYIKYL